MVERLQVRPLLLGSYLRFENDNETKYSIRLEGGQQISLTINDSAAKTLLVEINYQQGRPRLSLRDWWLGLTAGLARANWWRIPIAAAALLMIIWFGANVLFPVRVVFQGSAEEIAVKFRDELVKAFADRR